MKKRFFFGGLVAFLTIPLAMGAAVFANSNFSKQKIVKADNYSLTLNNTVFAMSELTTTYQQSVEQGFGKSYMPVMNYFLAKLDGSNNLVLAPSGKIYNYAAEAAYGGRVTDITSLTINYSGGTLFVQAGIGGGHEVYGEKVRVTSGTAVTFDYHPNYLMISNSSAETTVTSMTVNYSCNAEPGYSLGNLGEKYNGMGADSVVYTLERDGANVTVAGYPGTIALNAAGEFTITLAGGAVVYTGTVSADYKTLTFLTKTGAGADAAPSINEMNRVYVMDDFESYADRGTGFTADQTSVFTASNLRGAYYVDAGSGTGATWISGSGFKIPSTANYLNLTTAYHHGGNQAMVLQGQKAGWVRLWNSEVFNQNQQYNFGSGNVFSFWTRSGFQGPDLSYALTTNVTIRAQVYYQNFVLTDSNRNSTTYGTGTKDFTITKDSDWQECKITLDPSKSIYAVNIMINNSGLSADYAFMPIDDMTIYTQPVYQPPKRYDETNTSITKTYHGTVRVNSMDFTVKVGLGANGHIFAYAGTDMKPTSYSISGNTITIITTGDYNSLTFGTWTGTLSNNNKTITIPKSGISGTIQSYVNSSEIVLNEDNVIASGGEGTAGLQSAIKRQYNSSGWKDDTTGTGVTPTTDYYIEGGSGIAVGKSGAAASRIIVVTPVTFESLSFWFYIPASGTLTVRIYPYKEAGQTGGYPASLPFDKTYSDETNAGWHYVNAGIDKDYRGSFAIFLQTSSSAAYVDYITYF